MGSHKRVTSKSVLLDVLDFVEGEVELVEVLELEQGLAGHLAQGVARHVEAQEIPGEGVGPGPGDAITPLLVMHEVALKEAIKLPDADLSGHTGALQSELKSLPFSNQKYGRPC